jgi:hypothetical protein
MAGRRVALLLLALSAGTVCGGERLPLSRGLRAYYPFDKNASDHGGGGHDAENRGAAAVADGKFGGAFSFDGSRGHVSVPPAVTTGLRWATVSLWVRTTQSVGRERTAFWTNPTLVGASTPGYGSRDFGLMLEKGKAAYFHGLFREGVDFSWLSEEFVADGGWHHIAWVNAGPHARLYVDGTLARGEALAHPGPVSRGRLAHTPCGGRVGKSQAYVGACHQGVGGAGAAYFYRGVIDDLAIWSRALSAREVAAIARSTVPLGKLMTLGKD